MASRDAGSGVADFSLAEYTASVGVSFDSVGQFEADVPIQFGVPFQMTASVSGGAVTYPGLDGVVVMFIRVNELFVLGPDTVPLSDYRYVSLSNHDWFDGSRVQIPEPTTVELLILGLTACAALRHRAINRRLKPYLKH